MISAIYSTLGSNSSLVPLAIKDVANSVGLTAGSYVTGKDVEGKDRFIDEFGTQAIWLGGIPFYKKFADLTLYKILGIDPKVDVRNINYIEKLRKGTEEQKAQAEEFLKVLKEKTPDKFKSSIDKAFENPKFTKNLALAKFGISTVLAIGTYIGLTKWRQKYRLKQEMEQLKAEKDKQNEQTKTQTAPTVAAAQKLKPQTLQNTQKQSFGAFINNNKKGLTFTGLQDFMFNPVKNLMLLDGAITEERLRSSESKQEFINYAIKEGGTWAFMYFAGPIFQKLFENQAMDKHGIAINFDSRIIESKELEESIKLGTLKESLQAFDKLGKNPSDLSVYKFAHENPDNILVQMAKKADIITVDKKSKAIDTRAFLDLTDFKDLKDRLGKLLDASEGKNIDEFMEKVRKLKRGAIRTNIGICIAALGIGVPLMMIATRYLIPNNKEYKVKEAAAKKLAEEQAKKAKLPEPQKKL